MQSTLSKAFSDVFKHTQIKDYQLSYGEGSPSPLIGGEPSPGTLTRALDSPMDSLFCLPPPVEKLDTPLGGPWTRVTTRSQNPAYATGQWCSDFAQFTRLDWRSGVLS